MIKINTKGFTIIELLIATVVFSLVLLVVSAGIVQVGRSYYKGLAESRTLDATRGMVDDIAQAIQFSGGEVINSTAGDVKGFCIGNTLYAARPGQVALGTQHATSKRQLTSACGSTGTNVQPAFFNAGLGDKDMLGERMRVVNVDITRPSPSLYTITLRVAYGDNDTLCKSSLAASAQGGCNATATTFPNQLSYVGQDVQCKNSRSTSQFCAVTEITTTVQKRL